MISPSKAKRLIAKHSHVLGATTVPLGESLGFVLAEDVRSRFALPMFNNSAMDGFAFRAGDTVGASAVNPAELHIARVIYAGEIRPGGLGQNEAVGIMTGAALPAGADTVVAQEQALVRDGALLIEKPAEPKKHVRQKGEEIKKGQGVIRAGAVIHPGTIACLATLGRDRVRVVKHPRVSIIATGDETVRPGTKLKPGQIYDSNSYMMAASLKHMGMSPHQTIGVSDNPSVLEKATRKALAASDVLIVIGGVSVGERDFVRATLARQRVKEVFWRVQQKPGKPLYFGVRGKKLVFGLPGNPVSAFTCFYLYVYPALRRLAGYRQAELPARSLRAQPGFARDAKKWRFLQSRFVNTPAFSAAALDKQGSHMTTGLPYTDGLIAVPPGVGETGEEECEVMMLPHWEGFE